MNDSKLDETSPPLGEQSPSDPPKKTRLETEAEWLRRMAELEDGLPVSAGGWPWRILAPANTKPPAAADADTEKPAAEDHPSDAA